MEVGNFEQLHARTASRVDQCADISLARGRDAVERRRDVTRISGRSCRILAISAA
jgi:hypothetical protein